MLRRQHGARTCSRRHARAALPRPAHLLGSSMSLVFVPATATRPGMLYLDGYTGEVSTSHLLLPAELRQGGGRSREEGSELRVCTAWAREPRGRSSREHSRAGAAPRCAGSGLYTAGPRRPRRRRPAAGRALDEERAAHGGCPNCRPQRLGVGEGVDRQVDDVGAVGPAWRGAHERVRGGTCGVCRCESGRRGARRAARRPGQPAQPHAGAVVPGKAGRPGGAREGRCRAAGRPAGAAHLHTSMHSTTVDTVPCPLESSALQARTLEVRAVPAMPMPLLPTWGGAGGWAAACDLRVGRDPPHTRQAAAARRVRRQRAAPCHAERPRAVHTSKAKVAARQLSCQLNLR